ncbi:MAG: response regulator [Candidatus Krumholzibacteria bacterium]|nr:response regulator [Candidatus Krumholzibacteria bacterium]
MKKILIIEDDQKISMALSVRLKSKGYEVGCAFDGSQGVNLAVKNEPDLIILDISMPAGGGFLAAERLRNLANTANTPIVFITASKEPGLKEKARDLGAFAFLEKPFDARSLLAIIRRALGEPVPAGT